MCHCKLPYLSGLLSPCSYKAQTEFRTLNSLPSCTLQFSDIMFYRLREAGKWLLSDARLGLHALWFIWFIGRNLGLLKEGLSSWDITLANTSSMDPIAIPDYCSGAGYIHALSHLFLVIAVCVMTFILKRRHRNTKRLLIMIVTIICAYYLQWLC